MHDYPPPQCVYCRNFVEPEEDEPLVCRAFPDGIPRSILHSEKDHRNRVLGDHGFRFEPTVDAPGDAFWDERFAVVAS